MTLNCLVPGSPYMPMRRDRGGLSPLIIPSTLTPSRIWGTPAALVAIPKRSVRHTNSSRRTSPGTLAGQLSRNGTWQEASKKLSFCQA